MPCGIIPRASASTNTAAPAPGSSVGCTATGSTFRSWGVEVLRIVPPVRDAGAPGGTAPARSIVPGGPPEGIGDAGRAGLAPAGSP